MTCLFLVRSTRNVLSNKTDTSHAFTLFKLALRLLFSFPLWDLKFYGRKGILKTVVTECVQNCRETNLSVLYGGSPNY